MRREIQRQIDSIQEQLHAHDLEGAKLLGRLETLQEMLALAPEDSAPKKRTRKRSLSEHWQNVLYLMTTERPDGASYDEIHEMTERVGFEMKKANLRGHMGSYKAAGYVNAVSDGLFVVTTDGKKQAKKPNIEKPASEATGSPVLGAVTGRDDGYPPARPSGSIPDASEDKPPSIFDDEVTDMDDEIPF